MPWLSRALYGLLVLVAVLALAVTVFTLGGAFGFYTLIIGSPLTLGDMSSIAVAGGTLFLGAATALLTLSTRTAAAEARDEARANRAAARVMVVNQGQAMARHVVVTLEKIEPRNPMLDAPYQVPNGPLRHGTHVLPSTLQWKGHDKRRNLEVVCDVNPRAREYFDVLDFIWRDNSPWVLFWIDDWREAFELGFSFDGKQPPSPLVLNTEYSFTPARARPTPTGSSGCSS